MAGLYSFLEIYTPYILGPLILLGFAFWITSIFYSRRLAFYLKEKKPERFKELIRKDFFGQYLAKDNEKSFRYIFGMLDNEDRNILNFKVKIKKFMMLGLSISVGSFLVFIVLFAIATFSIRH